MRLHCPQGQCWPPHTPSLSKFEIMPFSPSSVMAVRIPGPLKIASSQEIYCFAGLILIILHFSDLVSFCCWAVQQEFWSRCSEVWVCKFSFCPKADCVTKGKSFWPAGGGDLFCYSGRNSTQWSKPQTGALDCLPPTNGGLLGWPLPSSGPRGLLLSVGRVEVIHFLRFLPTLNLYRYLKIECDNIHKMVVWLVQ